VGDKGGNTRSIKGQLDPTYRTQAHLCGFLSLTGKGQMASNGSFSDFYILTILFLDVLVSFYDNQALFPSLSVEVNVLADYLKIYYFLEFRLTM